MNARYRIFFGASSLVLGLLFLLAVPGFAAQGSKVTMLDTINAALAYNPELKAYQEGRQLSGHAVERAKAGHLPNVALYGGAGTSRRDDYNTRGRREDHKFRAIADVDLRLTQPLFHGFGIVAAVNRAAEEFASSENLLEEQGSSIVYAAIVAHTDVIRRAELVRLAKNNEREHAKILGSVSQRYNTGVATSGELNQVRSRYSRAKATVATYSAALDAARATYLRVTGNEPGDLERAFGPSQAYDNLDMVRKATLEHSPNLKSALATLRAVVHEKAQAESRFYPFLDLVAGPSWSDRQSKIDSHVTDLSAEVRLTWDLYSGGGDVAATRMAGAKIRQARQNLHGLMNALNEEIESTYSRHEAAAVEAKEYNDAKVASRRARNDYYRQFMAAKRSLIDVLDAENDFFYAASQEVMSLSDRMLSAYRLLAISGCILPEVRVDLVTLRVNDPTTQESSVNNMGEIPSPLSQGWVNIMVK